MRIFHPPVDMYTPKFTKLNFTVEVGAGLYTPLNSTADSAELKIRVSQNGKSGEINWTSIKKSSAIREPDPVCASSIYHTDDLGNIFFYVDRLWCTGVLSIAWPREWWHEAELV